MQPSGRNKEPGGRGPDVPGEVVAEAKAAFGRRSREPVAALVYDSLVEGSGSPSDHQLRFEHPLMSLELQVSSTGTGSDIRGRVMAAPQRVELSTEDETVRIVTPVADQRFAFHQVPGGMIRLTLTGAPEAPVVHTDWFRV